jgi:hypothetical protein
VVGHQLAQLVYRRGNVFGVATGERQVGLVARDADEGGRPFGGADGQRDSVDGRGIGRGVARRRDVLGRRAGQALVEMSSAASAASPQRGRQLALPAGRSASRQPDRFSPG